MINQKLFEKIFVSGVCAPHPVHFVYGRPGAVLSKRPRGISRRLNSFLHCLKQRVIFSYHGFGIYAGSGNEAV